MRASSSLSERDLVCVSKNQVSSEVRGEAVILNLADGTYYGLNPIGAHIWNLIQKPKSVAAIQAILLAEYDVEVEVCHRELLALLQELAKRGLIEVLDGTSE